MEENVYREKISYIKTTKFEYELGRIYPHQDETDIDISLSNNTTRHPKLFCRIVLYVYADKGDNRDNNSTRVTEVIGLNISLIILD